MSPIPNVSSREMEPGLLLNELERRQDDVLKQLDDLEDQLDEVLRGLGVSSQGDTADVENA